MRATTTRRSAPRSAVDARARTTGATFREAVARFGDCDALVELEHDMRPTYVELLRQVDRAARAFIAHGVRPGDGVGIWAQARYEWVVTQLAVARVGGVLVTIDPGCDTGKLEQQLREGRVGILMMGGRGADLAPVQMVVDALRGCPDLRRVIVFESDWERFLARGDSIGDGQLGAREASLAFVNPIKLQLSPCPPDELTS
jgi:fatty-acyl-CoA synthase